MTSSGDVTPHSASARVVSSTSSRSTDSTPAAPSVARPQITLEFQASLVYRQLAIELELMDLPGMSAWLRHQADEEIVHANKFIDHVADRDNHPAIGACQAPQAGVESVLRELVDDTTRALALCGVTSPLDVTRDLLA